MVKSGEQMENHGKQWKIMEDPSWQMIFHQNRWGSPAESQGHDAMPHILEGRHQGLVQAPASAQKFW